MRESEKLPHLSSARLKTWRKGDETEVDEKRYWRVLELKVLKY